MTAAYDPALREWAEAYLQEMRSCLRQDESIYQEHGAKAFHTIESTIADLLWRVRNSEANTNGKYNRQGDLAASLVVLGMEYPLEYTELMRHVVGGASIRTFNGACRLASVLNMLSDDHDYLLIQDDHGVQRLYHESNQPAGARFVPLTCSREFAAAVMTLLVQRGFVTGPSP